MADVTEALERLASLKDRGVLTQEEFDHQKALLLNPAVAPTAAPTAPYVANPAPPYAVNPTVSGSKTPLFAGGAILLLVAVAAALWATGTLAKLGIGSTPFGGSTSSTFSSTSGTSMSNPFGSSRTLPTTMPTAAPTYAPSDPGASVAGANPLFGTWDGETAGEKCPQRVIFTPTTMTMTGLRDGAPATDQEDVTYTAQGPQTFLVAPRENSSEKTEVKVEGDMMAIEECSFKRSSTN